METQQEEMAVDEKLPASAKQSDEASTSIPAESNTVKPTDVQPTPKPDNRIQFNCSMCGLCELTKYGMLSHKTISTNEEVFYIPDPFVPFDIHKVDFRVTDFVIFGSKCNICKLPVCVAKTCSIFYQHTYCLHCVQREFSAFPKEIVDNLNKRFLDQAKKVNEQQPKPAIPEQETVQEDI